MTPRKKVIGGTTSKGKVNTTVGGATSKRINNQSFAEGTTSATSQEPSVGTQPPQQQEDHLFQMLREMKEQMKEQQQKSDREQEQMILNSDNILHEQEKLKLLNQ